MKKTPASVDLSVRVAIVLNRATLCHFLLFACMRVFAAHLGLTQADMARKRTNTRAIA